MQHRFYRLGLLSVAQVVAQRLLQRQLGIFNYLWLHVLRLVNRLSLGLNALQAHYDKTKFLGTCFMSFGR